MKTIDAGPESNVENHLYLDEFRPYRDCLIWNFNRLFWRHLGDWEAASGKGFEAALPGGSSDANHPQAVSDSVADFWTLLRDLETRGQLPAEIVGLEIGVGSGARGRLARPLQGARRAVRHQLLLAPALHPRRLLADQPRARARGGGAPRRARERRPLDALNPFKALTPHRFKMIYVHLTNVYDNLPFDDLVRRDGKLYLVEVRAYLNGPLVDQLVADFGVSRADLPTAW